MNTHTWLPRLAAVALCVTAACGGNSDPTGPSDDPGVTTETRWDVDVTVRYVHSSTVETCDGTGFLGADQPGEYQYRITASYGGTTKTLETANYGSVLGQSVSLGKNASDNFANKTWSFVNLKAGEGVVLKMAVTEWDGTSKDSDMNNKSKSTTITPSSLLPSGGTKSDRGLGVGDSKCGLTLYYDVTATQRQVSVG